ncbi:hypothetical protein JCM10212_004001 [Sporobolomyces blumeae]
MATVYLPDDVLHRFEGSEGLWLYGWHGGRTTVVAGSTSGDFADAERLVETVARSLGTNLVIVGRDDTTDEAKRAGIKPVKQGQGLCVDLRKDASPRVTLDEHVGTPPNVIWSYEIAATACLDILLGLVVGFYLYEHAEDLSASIDQHAQATVSASLRELAFWLDNWPAGIKLNAELSTLLSNGFLFALRLWETFILEPLVPLLPAILKVAAIASLSSFGGVTSLLAFASDLIAVLSLPYFACYFLSATIYRWALVALSALVNVFRGKMYNPLRARTEPATYEVDALLLGTMLLVTLLFLFPTVLVYYLVFATTRLALVAIETVLATTIRTLNSLPITIVYLRFTAPSAVPGRIRVRPCRDQNHLDRTHAHLEASRLEIT